MWDVRLIDVAAVRDAAVQVEEALSEYAHRAGKNTTAYTNESSTEGSCSISNGLRSRSGRRRGRGIKSRHALAG